MAKFNIEAFVDDNEDGRISERRARLKRQLDGKSVVLRNDKVRTRCRRMRYQILVTGSCMLPRHSSTSPFLTNILKHRPG